MILLALLAILAGVGLFLDADFLFSAPIRIPLGISTVVLGVADLFLLAGVFGWFTPIITIMMAVGGVILIIGDRSSFKGGEDQWQLWVATFLIANGLVLGWQGLRIAMRRARSR